LKARTWSCILFLRIGILNAWQSFDTEKTWLKHEILNFRSAGLSPRLCSCVSLPSSPPAVFALIWLLWLTGRMNIYARINTLQYLACKLRANSGSISFPVPSSSCSRSRSVIIILACCWPGRTSHPSDLVINPWHACRERKVLQFLTAAFWRPADFAYDYMKFASHYFVCPVHPVGPVILVQSRCPAYKLHLQYLSRDFINPNAQKYSQVYTYIYVYISEMSATIRFPNWWAPRTRSAPLLSMKSMQMSRLFVPESTKLLPLAIAGHRM